MVSTVVPAASASSPMVSEAITRWYDPRSRQKLGELVHEVALAARPDESLHQEPVPEDKERGDAHSVEATSGLGVLVDVELRHAELVVVLFGDRLQRGGEHLARSTPLGPEVDHDGQWGRGDLLVECGVGQLVDVDCHRGSLSPRIA